jgi:predicted metal-binding membrane protein
MRFRVSMSTANAPVIVAMLTGLTIVSWLVMLSAHSAHEDQHALLIWGAMTIGMMAPSAVPMVTTYARVAPQLDPRSSVGLAVSIFTAAYLILWLLFAAIAAALQGEMQRLLLIDDSMVFTTPWLSSMLLIAAGLYQLTPLKQVCVSKCRSPLGFLLGAYRTGYGGAFATGLLHGAFCIGCCWLLMALVWVGGMMNLVWMALLSPLVILEKTAPRAEWFVRWSGAAMVAFGVVLLVLPRSDALLTLDTLANLCRHRA